MCRFLFAAFVVVGLLLASSEAQGEKKKNGSKKIEPATPKGGAEAASPGGQPIADGVPGECEIYFLNGSKVRMLVKTQQLEIATLYGKLTVPMQDVQSIEFGVHFPEGMEAKINQAIKDLGSTEFRKRDMAAKMLIDVGQYSYPAVVKTTRTKETLEVIKRAKEVIEKIQAKYPKKDLKNMVEDKVVTPTHTIVGRIVTTTVKTKSDYFGEIDHQLAHMRTLRAVGAASLDLDVSVDASKYANQGEWMETAYQVDNRYGLIITAKGMVDTWPQQPGGYMSGPLGTSRQSMPGQKVIGAITAQTYGSVLVGKIGADGEPFVIGDRYDGKPEAEGRLYLHIGPSRWNCPSAGAFEVKISRKGE